MDEETKDTRCEKVGVSKGIIVDISKNIPYDCNNLFWSIMLAYLTPIKDDNAQFLERFSKMFGRNAPYYNSVQAFVKEYNVSVDLDVDFEIQNLIVDFRRRVICCFNDKIVRSDALKLKLFPSNESSWAGPGDLEAASVMLNVNISVIKLSDTKKVVRYPLTRKYESDIEIILYYKCKRFTNNNYYMFGEQMHFGVGNFKPGHSDILPPISNILKDDRKLELSFPQFKNIIIQDLVKVDEIVSPYPTHYTLALFSSKMYKKYSHSEFDKTLAEDFPGWKLLTLARNDSLVNGYSGAALWHARHRHIVIVHRGTKLTNFGCLWSDCFGIKFTYEVGQIRSACKFTDTVVRALTELRREGHHLELFFTGHSLGAWLAQITTFSAEYLEIGKSQFVRRQRGSEGVHAHTVVFDSPGVRGYLMQVQDHFDLRYDGSIQLRDLDIVGYLSSPNRINTCNFHIGTLYRIFVDVSDISRLAEATVVGFKAHELDRILKTFDPATGYTRKLKLQVVTDWPNSDGILPGEYGQLFKWANKVGRASLYDVPGVTSEYEKRSRLLLNLYPIRYRCKPFDELVSWTNTFTRDMRIFLEKYSWLRKFPCTDVFSSLDSSESDEIRTLLNSCIIENDMQRFKSVVDLRFFGPKVSRLMRRHSGLVAAVHDAMAKSKVKFYESESSLYLDEIKEMSQNLIFSNAESLCEFGNNVRVCHLKGAQEIQVSLSKIYAGIKPAIQKYTFLKLSSVLTYCQRLVRFEDYLSDLIAEQCLIIVCDLKKNNYRMRNLAKKLFKNVLDNLNNDLYEDIKLIFLSERDDHIDYLTESANILGNKFVTKDDSIFSWDHLSDECRNALLSHNVVIFQDRTQKISLRQLLGVEGSETIMRDVHPDVLFNLVIGNRVAIGKKTSVLSDLEAAYVKRYKGITADILIDHLSGEESQYLYLITGIDMDKFLNVLNAVDMKAARVPAIEQQVKRVDGDPCKRIYVTPKAESVFKEFCCKHGAAERSIYLIAYRNNTFIWEQAFSPSFYMKRQLEFNDTPFIDNDNSDEDDVEPLLLKEEDFSCRVSRSSAVIIDEPGMGKTTTLTKLSEYVKGTAWVIRTDFKDCARSAILNLPLNYEEMTLERAIEFLSSVGSLSYDGDLILTEAILKYKIKIGVADQQWNPIFLFDAFDEIKNENDKERILVFLSFLKDVSVPVWVTARKHETRVLESCLGVHHTSFRALCSDEKKKLLEKYWQIRLKLTLSRNDFQNVFAERSKFHNFSEELLIKAENVIGTGGSRLMGVPLQLTLLAGGFLEHFEMYIKTGNDAPNFYELNILSLFQYFICAAYRICLKEKFGCDNVDNKFLEKLIFEPLSKIHRRLAFKEVFGDAAEDFSEEDDDVETLKQLLRIGLVQITRDGHFEFTHLTFREYFTAESLVTWLKTSDKNPLSLQARTLVVTRVLTRPNFRVVRCFLNCLLAKQNLADEVYKAFGSVLSFFCWRRDKYASIVLHYPAAENQTEIIFFILKSLQEEDQMLKVLLDTENSTGRTPLFEAAANGHLLAVQMLIEKSDINVSHGGRALLETCALYGKPDILYWLVEYADADVFMKNPNGGNVLTAVAESKAETKWETLKWLIKWVKSSNEENYPVAEFINSTGRKGRTAMHLAAAAGEMETVEFLLLHGKADFTIKDSAGKTALLTLAKHGEWKMIRWLVNNGSGDLTECINARDDLGESVLYEAAVRKQWEEIKYLATYCRVDLLMGPGDGESVANAIVKRGSWETILWLVENNKLTDDNGRETLVNIIARSNKPGKWDTIHKLLGLSDKIEDKSLSVFNNNQFDERAIQEYVNRPDRSGLTVLHRAILSKEWNVVESLIGWDSVDVSVQDRQKRTALHLIMNRTEIDLIHQINAEVSLNDKDDNELGICLERLEKFYLCKFLVECGLAAVTVTDLEGSGPLCRKAQSGHWDVLLWLLTENGLNLNENIENLSVDANRDAWKILKSLQPDKDRLERLVLSFIESESSYGRAAKWLFKLGEDMDLCINPDTLGRDVLHQTISNGHWGTAKVLVKHFNVDINAVCDGKTVLHTVIKNGNWDMMEWFIKHGNAELGAVDSSGETAFNLTARSMKAKKWDAVNWLINYTKENNIKVREFINIKDKFCISVLQRAVYSKQWELMKTLVDAGADYKVVNRKGETLLEMMCTKSAPVEYVAWLMKCDISYFKTVLDNN